MIKKALGICADTILIAIGVYGAIFCFVSAFAFTVDSALLGACSIGFAILFSALFSIKKLRRFWVFLLLGVGIGIFVALEFSNFLASMRVVFYRMLLIGAQELGRSAPDLAQGLSAQALQADVTGALICISALLAAFLAWAVVAHRSFGVAFLSTMVLLATPLFLTITPDWLALMMLLAFWTVLLFVSIAHHSFRADTATLPLALLPVVGAIILVMMLLFPQATYERAPFADELRERIIVWDFNFKNHERLNIGEISAEGNTDFRDLGSQSYDGTIMLYIEDASGQAGYYRSDVGAVYTGTGFVPIAENDYYTLEQNMSRSLINMAYRYMGERRSVTIRYAKADAKKLYIPYYFAASNETHATFEYVHDLYVRKPGDEKEVTLDVYGKGRPYDIHFANQYDQYEAFVFAQYLQTPTALAEKLRALAAEHGIAPYVGQDAQQLGAQVANMVQAYASYTLTPGLTPRNRDFVEYFLFENQKGYCVHFATATVMALRALGLPARYASGYVVRSSDFDAGGTAAVPDRNAHAWVEIYAPGEGWVVLEATPGGSPRLVSESIYDDGPREETHALRTPPPQQQQQAESTAAPESTVAAPTPVPEAELDDTQEMPPAPIPTVLYVLGGVALTAGLYAACRVIVLQLRKKRFTQGPPNSRAIAIFLQYERIAKAGGFAIEREALEIAQKARFSPHTLSEAEVETLHAALQEAKARLYRQSPVYVRPWHWL